MRQVRAVDLGARWMHSRGEIVTRKACRKEPRYVSKLAVWVPDAISMIEMCRYDSCYPDSEADSYKVQALIANRAKPEDHVIFLTRAARGDGPPTLRRWQSFGAKVLSVWHPDDSPPTIEDLRQVALLEGVRP